MKPLCVHAIQTRIFRQGESLSSFVVESIPKNLVRDGIVLAVTSKIVSLAENRVIDRKDIDKRALVEREADVFLGEIGHGCFLTIKDGLLIASAGIDESNSETGGYILFPKNSFQSAETLWRELRQAWNIRNLGIVITDSHTTALRKGVTGVCLSYFGFYAVKSLIGTADLFGRELRMTQMNFADGIAASAVMMMGEGAEAQPLAVVENTNVEFTEVAEPGEMHIPLEEDLYYPLISSFTKS
jgi:F420-0:gamma-glutamyl ligase